MADEPTHVVPRGGLPAWAVPDGSTTPEAELPAGIELRVLERQGDWARVEASNGWVGWVDGRALVERPGDAVPPPPPPPPPHEAPPTLPVTTTVTGELGKPRSIGVSILLAVVTLGIYTYVWTYLTHEEIKRHSGLGLGGVLGLVLYLVIWPVTLFAIAAEVRQLYERSGRTSPVHPLWGLWFLLPLIGMIVWFVRVQGALNEYWTSHGARRP